MICEIIFSKNVCGIFLIFSSRFKKNFVVNNNFLEPQNREKLSISRPIYLKKISTQCLEGLISTNKPEKNFFKKIIFQGLGAFFTTAKPLIWALWFYQKNNFILFLECDYLILTQQNHALKIYAEKLREEGNFTLLNK